MPGGEREREIRLGCKRAPNTIKPSFRLRDLSVEGFDCFLPAIWDLQMSVAQEI